MKNLYLIILILISNFVDAQSYVEWDETTGPVTILNGTFGNNGTVTVQVQGPNFPVEIESHVGQNLVVPDDSEFTFSTQGPNDSYPAQQLTFTFSEPVIITQYNMSDIDRDIRANDSWDDSFDFVGFQQGGLSFTSVTSINATVDVLGANVSNDPFETDGYASWLCLNEPVDTLTLEYIGNNTNLTTALLGYSIQVLQLPSIDESICVGGNVNFPDVGDGINGTWDPAVINTDEAGITTYTFTPNNGEEMQCEITMDVEVIECGVLNPPDCQDFLITSDPISTMIQEERELYIEATNVITFSDNIQGNGVVYHAGDYIELNPGFDAVMSSQFAAYIEECSGEYVYREGNQGSCKIKEIKSLKANSNKFDLNVEFDLIHDFGNNTVNVSNNYENINYIEILSLQGNSIFSKKIGNSKSATIDLSDFDTGIYFINIVTNTGRIYTDKLIRK